MHPCLTLLSILNNTFHPPLLLHILDLLTNNLKLILSILNNDMALLEHTTDDQKHLNGVPSSDPLEIQSSFTYGLRAHLAVQTTTKHSKSTTVLCRCYTGWRSAKPSSPFESKRCSHRRRRNRIRPKNPTFIVPSIELPC